MDEVSLANLVETNFQMFPRRGGGGFLPLYDPIILMFSKPCVDLWALEDKMFGTDNPFDLYGVSQADRMRNSEDQPWKVVRISVQGLDIVTVKPARMELFHDFIKFYCSECNGKTFVKLVKNLRKYFDAGVAVCDHRGKPFRGSEWFD